MGVPLAAQLDAYEANDSFQAPREPDFANLDETFSASAPAEPDSAPAAAPTAPAAKNSVFGSLELMPMDAEMEAPVAAAAHASARDVAARPNPSLRTCLRLISRLMVRPPFTPAVSARRCAAPWGATYAARRVSLTRGEATPAPERCQPRRRPLADVVHTLAIWSLVIGHFLG